MYIWKGLGCMAAHYDNYDYPAYWTGRDYEHKSELIAISYFLKSIPHKFRRVVELGGGYGRMVTSYMYRADKIVFSDPSRKLISIAEKNLAHKLKKRKIQFVQSTVENAPKKIKKKSADLIIMIRVLHHIKDIDKAFTALSQLSTKNGYLIIEFANKVHAKASLKELLHGNFTFPLDISPKDIRSDKSISEKTLPFVNYHPEVVIKKLEEHGYKIIEMRSVSNVRNEFLKRVLPEELLLSLENLLQKPFAKLFFGPSIFLLARKVG